MESDLDIEESGLRVVIICAIALILGGSALGLELLFPNEVYVAVVYVAPILMARLLHQLPQIVVLAAAVSVFPLTGHLIVGSESLLSESAVDRWLLIAVIWLVALVDWFYRLTRSKSATSVQLPAGRAHAALQRSRHVGGTADKANDKPAVTNDAIIGLITSLCEPCIVFDAEGRIVSFNEHARRLFGYESAMMQSLDAERLSPDHRTSPRERHLKDLFSSSGVVVTAHAGVAARRRDGSRFVVDAAIGELRQDDGTLHPTVIRDMTASREKLAQTARGSRRKGIGEIGQFTGEIAHRLASQLSIISGNLDLLDPEIKKVATAGQFFEPLSAAVKNVADLSRDLMRFGKPRKFDMQPIDPSKVLLALQTDLQAILGEKVKLEVDAAKLRFPIRTDPAEFDEAVRELVRNAARAMPDGGTVSIASKRLIVTGGDSHLYGNLAPGPYVEISFIDDGTGMESDVSAVALDPFFTTKDAGNHVGLGLNKVKNFLDHCGAILVMGTEIEKGTTASMIFPAFEEPESSKNSRKARRRSYSARPDPKRTVLVVSRDAEARKVRARLIVSLGQNAPIASTADEALDQVAENAMIDMVFLDADFSRNLSGRELAEQIRTLRPDLKILFAVTGAEHDDLKMDGADTIRQPIWRRDVGARLRSLIDAG